MADDTVKDEPFGLIDECIFNMDGESEILTILGVEKHGFGEFGDLLDEDAKVDGPFRLPESQHQEQQPAVPVEQRQDVSQGAVSIEGIQVRAPPGLFQPDPLVGEDLATSIVVDWKASVASVLLRVVHIHTLRARSTPVTIAKTDFALIVTCFPF